MRAIVVANADQTQSLPTTGEIDFAGSALLKRTQDTTVCTATSTCNMMGNADVTIDLDTMLLAGEIYDLDNNTAINWDGEMSLKGTVQTDGSVTAELSGSYTNPGFGTPYVVAASNLDGSVLDYGAGTVNAINIEGDATVSFNSGTPVAHSFGLIALSD